MMSSGLKSFKSVTDSSSNDDESTLAVLVAFLVCCWRTERVTSLSYSGFVLELSLNVIVVVYFEFLEGEVFFVVSISLSSTLVGILGRETALSFTLVEILGKETVLLFLPGAFNLTSW